MSAAAKTLADLIADRFGLPATAGAALPAEGPVAQLLAHRTHRRYRRDPVPDDVLRRGAGRRAVRAVEVGPAAGGDRRW